MIGDDISIMSNDFLFGDKAPTERKNYYRYIRCDECIYSTPYKVDNRYVRCGKYPNMLSLRDKTCKSAVKK